MALVANEPWLKHLILHLKAEGITEFVIAVKHFQGIIRQYFGDGRALGVSIEYAVEPRLLGTAGAIKNAEHRLGDRFLVVNADIVHDIPLVPLLDFHLSHGGGVTIALTEVEDPSHYGVVDLDRHGSIRRFVEKPKAGEAPSNLINAGIYVMDRRVLDYIPKGKEVSVERETFPLLIEQGIGVYGHKIHGYWLDMGTKERYRQVHWDILKRKFAMPLRGKESADGIWLGNNVTVGKGALFVPPVLIGDDVQIGERSTIGPFTVIGHRSVIGANVRVSESILWEGCRVHRNAQLNNCIFGHGLELGSEHILHEAVMSRVSGGDQQ
jgi:mannose-1-phosphate guanylyltransferase